MQCTDKPLKSTHGEFATRLKMTLESVYTLGSENTRAKHERQDFYNQKVHGKPFSAGDQVWLFSPAVPRGKFRRPHHPGQDNGWLSGNCQMQSIA